ncbi:MAG: type VI secretion system tube protein Hcp [Bryobacterales bacterium]|nr:type VI secretion system tube protein Hcp [Bryobacterales bacterium]
MFDAFCKVDQVPGESTDDKHKDWIEVLSYSHHISQPRSATKSSAGGAGTERCEHGEFVIVKQLDKASPKLYEFCSSGKHLKDVTLELCRAGGDKVKYLEVKLEEVLVCAVSPGGSAKGGDNLPVEEVRFDYGKIKWTYTQQKRADGSGGGNVTGGWDLTANKVQS